MEKKTAAVTRALSGMTKAFRKAARDIRFHGKDAAPRGLPIKELINYSFEPIWVDESEVFLASCARKFSRLYMAGELAWYLSGSQAVDDVSYYSSFWKKCAGEDGLLNSAYGYHIWYDHDLVTNKDGDVAVMSQFQKVAAQLQEDTDTRQAVIHIKDKFHTTDFSNPDVPCTMTLQFFIRDGRLDMIVNMRSSDLIRGISYDMPFFMIAQKLLAVKLGIKPGWYYHNSGSLHVYELHYDMLKRIAEETDVIEMFEYDGPYIGDIPESETENETSINEMLVIEKGLRAAYENGQDMPDLASLRELVHPFWWGMIELLVAQFKKKTLNKKDK